MKAARFFGNAFGSRAFSCFVIKDIAAMRDRVLQDYFAMMTVAGPANFVTIESASTNGDFSVAECNRISRIDRATAKRSNRGEDFEGRTWRPGPSDRLVSPSAARFDVVSCGLRERWRKIGEIVVGFARENQHLAGAHVERDGRPELITDRFFGNALKIDVQRRHDRFSLHRGTVGQIL